MWFRVFFPYILHICISVNRTNFIAINSQNTQVLRSNDWFWWIQQHSILYFLFVFKRKEHSCCINVNKQAICNIGIHTINKSLHSMRFENKKNLYRNGCWWVVVYGIKWHLPVWLAIDIWRVHVLHCKTHFRCDHRLPF